MKRTIIILTCILASCTIAAGQDWGNLKRYKAANEKVGKGHKAVLMGDSITDIWDNIHPGFFTENDFIGRGISGQVTSEMLLRFHNDVISLNPEYVMILAGTNDIAMNQGYISPENILSNIAAMCEMAEANDIKVIIASILPAHQYGWRPQITGVADMIIQMNGMLKKYANKRHYTYLDFHSAMKDSRNGLPEVLSKDGVHPTAEGFSIMEEIVLKAIRGKRRK